MVNSENWGCGDACKKRNFVLVWRLLSCTWGGRSGLSGSSPVQCAPVQVANIRVSSYVIIWISKHKNPWYAGYTLSFCSNVLRRHRNLLAKILNAFSTTRLPRYILYLYTNFSLDNHFLNTVSSYIYLFICVPIKLVCRPSRDA